MFGRAESTVREHIDAACEKCGVGNQCELVALYARGTTDERVWREALERVHGKKEGAMTRR
jgi:hypothetical protein